MCISRFKTRRCLKVLAASILAAFPSLVLGQEPAVSAQPSPAPVESEPPSGVLTGGIVLLSIVPKSLPLVCSIGTNNVVMDGTVEEMIGPGSTTGLIPWSPPKEPLRAQAKGYMAGVLRPFVKDGETPVVLLLERPSGALAFEVIPNATDRGTNGFYDAINLTAKPALEIIIDGKPVALAKGRRVRVSTEKKLTYSIPGGGGDTLGTDNPPYRILIFHQDAQGKTICSAMPDMLLR